MEEVPRTGCWETPPLRLCFLLSLEKVINLSRELRGRSTGHTDAVLVIPESLQARRTPPEHCQMQARSHCHTFPRTLCRSHSQPDKSIQLLSNQQQALLKPRDQYPKTVSYSCKLLISCFPLLSFGIFQIHSGPRPYTRPSASLSSSTNHCIQAGAHHSRTSAGKTDCHQSVPGDMEGFISARRSQMLRQRERWSPQVCHSAESSRTMKGFRKVSDNSVLVIR